MRKILSFGLGMIMLFVMLFGVMATPDYLSGYSNSTKAGSVCQMSHSWTGNISGGILSYHFQGEGWTNKSWTVTSGTWTNDTITLEITEGVTSWRYYSNNTDNAWNVTPVYGVSTIPAFNETYKTGTCPISDEPTALIFILIGVLIIAMIVIGWLWATMPIWNMVSGIGLLFYSFPLYGCFAIFGGVITAFGIMVITEAVIRWRLGK